MSGKDKLVLRRDPDTGEYYKCRCGSLIVEGKEIMQNWGWCPLCRFPRIKHEVTKVKNGRWWNLDTGTWEDVSI